MNPVKPYESTSGRRDFLRNGLRGAAGVAFWRSVATGLPLAWILGDRRESLAEESPGQYLILNLSGAGDPLNAGAPGTFGVANVEHNKSPDMAETPLALGSNMTSAAKPWAGLPDWVRARSVFFHHRTYTNTHPNFFKVLGLFGAAKNAEGRGGELLPSLYAGELASALGTLQKEPVTLARLNTRLTYEGRVVQSTPPSALAMILAGSSAQDVAKLESLRESALDRMHQELTANGTPAQRAYFDRYAQSRSQLKELRDRLGALVGVDPESWEDDVDSQVDAAVAMIQLRVAPIVVTSIPMGGDNHTDQDLVKEAEETVSGVAAIGNLLTKLKSAGLEEKVTFATFNVFGRTLARVRNGNGRNHNQNHHVTFMTGSGLRPGVVGGIEPLGSDFAATGIDSASGAASANGDIPPERSLESVAKTLAHALGIPPEVADGRIEGGKRVASVSKG